MNRFPILQAYRSFLRLAALLLVVAGFVTGVMAAQAASGLYLHDNPGASFLTDIFIKVVVFSAVYAVGMVIASLPLIFAEGLALRLSIEEHLYHLRHADTLAADFQQLQQTQRIARQHTQGIGTLAVALFGGWLLDRQPAADTAAPPEAARAEMPARPKTGTTGRLDGTGKPVTGRLGSSVAAAPAPTGPLKREVLPGKPKTAPLRPTVEMMQAHMAPAEPAELEDETGPVESPTSDVLPVPSAQPGTIRTQEMVALSKQSKTLRDPNASYNFRKAVEQFEAEKYPVSIQYLDRALAIDPAYGNAYRLRAACYRRMNDVEHAKADMALYQQYIAEQIPQ